MLSLLKKLISPKIKSYIKSVFYFFLMYIKKLDNKIVYLYLINNQKNDLKKVIRIKFFNYIFFIPKTIRNAYIIQRTEKEKEEIKLIHEKFSRPLTYIDIGANIGYWTFARNYVLEKKINFYCFEPSKLNFKYLEKNLDRFENIKIVKSF